MKQSDIINSLTNALGNPHFSEQEVIDALREQAEKMKAEGKNPGSLYTVANLIAEITIEAKNRYEK